MDLALTLQKRNSPTNEESSRNRRMGDAYRTQRKTLVGGGGGGEGGARAANRLRGEADITVLLWKWRGTSFKGKPAMDRGKKKERHSTGPRPIAHRRGPTYWKTGRDPVTKTTKSLGLPRRAPIKEPYLQPKRRWAGVRKGERGPIKKDRRGGRGAKA